MTVKLTIKGLEELQAEFAKLGGQLPKVLRNVAVAVGEEVRRVAQTYPKQNHSAASAAFTFASDKQRRWFFAALREGKIDVPYNRTRKLRDGWNIKSRGTQAIVGNEVPYAPYVHSPGGQTSMMAAIGWPTTEDIRDRVESGGRIKRIVQKVIGDALARIGL